jgi:N-acetylglutamate synthase-like GNAT family acetyltransferase
VETPALSARRATVEDLPALQALWQQAGLPWLELERFVTEFQVVPAEGEGVLLAAIGLLVEENDALLHTEAIADPALADELRATLWRRVQIVARNQGVYRIWTQEDADYWRFSGFVKPSPAAVAETAATFVDKSADWQVCDLIDPDKAQQLVNEQMAIWEAKRMQESEALQGRIQSFRRFALGFAILVTLAALGMFFYIILLHPEILKQFLPGGHGGHATGKV